MIARTTLTRPILENPIKNRVTACRKRVRDNRGGHGVRRRKAVSLSERNSEMAQFPSDSLEVRQSVTLELLRTVDDQQDPAESVVQEVGIT